MSRFTTCARVVMRAAPLFNAPVAAISYTGRRSGHTFTTPVAYRRSGSDIVMAANMPDAKTW